MYLNFFLAKVKLLFFLKHKFNTYLIANPISAITTIFQVSILVKQEAKRGHQLQQKHISTKSWQTDIGIILAKLQNILSPENGRKWQNRDFRDLQPIIRIICKGVRVHLHLGQCTMAISYFTNDPRFVGFEIRFFFQEAVAYQLHVCTATYSSIRM